MKMDHAFFALIEMLSFQQYQIDCLEYAIESGIRDRRLINKLIREKNKPADIKKRTAKHAKAFQKLVKIFQRDYPKDNFAALIDRQEWPSELDLGLGEAES